MGKVYYKGIVLIGVFLLSWAILCQVNWIKIFNVEKHTENTEESIGDAFWDFFKKTEKEISDSFINKTVDSLLNTICSSNNIDRKKIKLHIIEKDEVNAFALPGKHLVLYSGLIEESDNEGELAGVVAHELAHIYKNHVMKKLVKEIGLSVLVAITTNGDASTIREAVRLLSSTAFDRKMEKEADLYAVQLLLKSDINPEYFANFLYRMDTDGLHKTFNMISTHPDSKNRSEYIMKEIERKKISNKLILSMNTWDTLKVKLKKYSYEVY